MRIAAGAEYIANPTSQLDDPAIVRLLDFQSSSAQDLEDQVAAAVDEVVALNEGDPGDPTFLWGGFFMDLAGAGYGDVFTMSLQLVETVNIDSFDNPFSLIPNNDQDLGFENIVGSRFFFYEGATKEALQADFERALERMWLWSQTVDTLTVNFNGVAVFQTDVAGATQGTKYMGVFAANISVSDSV